MIIKHIACSLLLFVFSCSNIEFVLKDNALTNPLKDKTMLLIDKNSDDRFVRGLYSRFGNNETYEYILKTKYSENKTLKPEIQEFAGPLVQGVLDPGLMTFWSDLMILCPYVLFPTASQ